MTRRSDMGVIFDMDGVLVDSAEPHFRSWQCLAEEIGERVTPDQFMGTFGRQNRDIIPILFGSMAEEDMQALSDRKEELFRELIQRNPPVVSGAVDLVASLAETGVRLAVGSSGPRANIEMVLSAMGVRGRFDAVVCAEDVSRGKPDPEVFRLAAARMGLAPFRCVVIEDAPAGIQAALAAGARAVAVLTTHGPEAFEGPEAHAVPHAVIRRLADLSADWLVQILGAS